MNKLVKKAAAALVAGLIAVSGIGIESFAQSREYTAETVTMAYKASTVAKPTYTIKGEKGIRYVRLSTATSGAAIYYTTDGSKPNSGSTPYATGSLIPVKKKTQIRAVAVKGFNESAVMTKTVSVTSICGDITGDGNINQIDYTRLKNYIAGKTSFICRDNADTNGDGNINSKDLEALSLYLNGTVSSLPTKAAGSIKGPKVTVYSSYGCKKIEFTGGQSGATLYYTTNGTDPTTSSSVYTSKFPVYTSCTVKVMAYKNGLTSSVREVKVDVPQCAQVDTNKNTSTVYDNSVSVNLSCSTPKSRIYYTTDGSDPHSSSSKRLYSGAITVNQSSSIRAYAEAKGYTDSTTAYYNYNVKIDSGFSIRGTVWNDTPNETSVANGVRAANESGISGITVELFNVSSNTVAATTTTANDGSYIFTNIELGYVYKVQFKFNGQKYRAFDKIIANGNQATTPASTIPSLTIRNGGAYSTSGAVAVKVNNYNSAITSSFYQLTASTPSTYKESAANVDLALISTNYGSLAMALTMVGQDPSTNNVANGATLSYNITINNNSVAQTLSDAEVDVYLTNAFSDISVVPSNTGNQQISYKYLGTEKGFHHYTVSNIVPTAGLAPGDHVTFVVTARVNAGASTKIQCFAEVVGYRYANSCYDKDTIPGNMTKSTGSTFSATPKEKDEASSPVVKVIEISPSSGNAQTISSTTKAVTVLLGEVQKNSFTVVIQNATSRSLDALIQNSDEAICQADIVEEKAGSTLLLYFTITGRQVGKNKITIYLMKDTSKKVEITVTVLAA